MLNSWIVKFDKKFRDVDPAFDRIENYESFGYRWRNTADG